jgi:hypothetical protein|tara:strand:+ start:557 stop:928 length:372 start_codon:yes stop_codon:yes gene_type:complete
VSENLKQMPDNVDTIEDLVKYSLEKDYNKANEVFGNVMSIKMNDVLDQAKTKIAGQIYNEEDPDPEEPLEDEDFEENENEDEEDIEDEDTEDEDGEEEIEDEEDGDESEDDEEDEKEIEGAAV